MASTNLGVGGALQQVGPGTFVLGKVRLNQPQRSIRFPAVLNMNQGAIEYVIVTASGKTHESLLRTDAEPFQVHAAMLLLNAKGVGTNTFALDAAQPLPGDRLAIEVKWKTADKSLPIARFVYNRQTKTAMDGRWVYTGSHFEQGQFVAQRDGSIVSLINDPDALMNYAGPGRDNDEIWDIIGTDLPPLGTEAEVTVRLE